MYLGEIWKIFQLSMYDVTPLCERGEVRLNLWNQVVRKHLQIDDYSVSTRPSCVWYGLRSAIRYC